jgi:WD40 repeat protein
LVYTSLERFSSQLVFILTLNSILREKIMRKSLAAWIFLLAAMLGCNLSQPTQKDIPPLEFPDLAPTYTPIPPFPAETPGPEIVTATPVTPSPTPATISLQKLAKWTQAEASDAFWYPDSGRFGIVSPGELTIYQTSTIKKAWSIAPEGREGLFQAVSISSNGNFIVNFNTGPAVNIFDADDGELSEKKRAFEQCGGGSPLKSVYLGDGMKRLFTASQEAQKANAPVRIYKWALSPYGCDFVDSVTAGRFSALLLSPDERFLVLVTSSGLTGQVTAWNVSDGKQICTIQGAAAAFHRDGRLAVADMQKEALVYWRVDSCRVSSELPWVGYAERQSMAFTPNGKYLLTFRQGIQVWDATTAGLLFERLIPEAATGGLLRLSPDGRYLLSISNPGALNAQIDFWSIGDK